MFDINFYQGKKVFITGHTGFKGSWLCKILSNAGAVVTGYSLEPSTNPSLYDVAEIDKDVNSKNFSAFNNIGTLYLLENSKENIKQGITAKIKLIESIISITFKSIFIFCYTP